MIRTRVIALLGIALLLVATPAAHAANDFDDVVAYWLFEENLNDSSGNGNTLSAHGSPAPAYSTTCREGSYSLDDELSAGNYTDRADADLSSGFPGKDSGGAQNLTVSAWVRPESLPATSKWAWIFDKYSNPADRSYRVNITNVSGVNKWDAAIGYGDGSTTEAIGTMVTPANAIAVSQWYHVAFTVDASGNWRLRVYDETNDAVDEETGTFTNFPFVCSASIFAIGGRAGATTYNWDGLIDEVVVWDRALTGPELTSVQQGNYSSGGSGLGGQQDFTTWVTVDDTNDLSVAVNSITVNPYNRDTYAYVYKDFGDSYFTDCTVRFIWKGAAEEEAGYMEAPFFVWANDVGDWMDLLYQEKAGLEWYYNHITQRFGFVMYVGTYSAQKIRSFYGTDPNEISPNVDYYITIQKVSTGGEYGYGYYDIKVRTGSHSGTLVASKVLDDESYLDYDFRYAYGFMSYHHPNPSSAQDWETSGTLSYLQVDPNDSAPAKASNPSPADDATGVAVSSNLSWSAAQGADTYQVYWGLESTAIGECYQTEITGTNWDPPGNMSYSTDYHWRIDPNNEHGTTTGDVWEFTTEAAPSGAPPKATNPSPPDEAYASISTDLSWSASTGATGYDVYFGLATTAIGELYVGNTASPSWTLDDLLYDTEYHWRIDPCNLEGTTTGDVWTFTTITDDVGEPLNHFEVDPNVVMLLRFESTASLPVNSAALLDGVNTGVTRNTTAKREWTSSGEWDGSDTIIFPDANQPESLFDGDSFSICGWFRMATLGDKDLLHKGAVGMSNLSASLGIYDAGAVESFQVCLGYNGGASQDTYTHATDLSASEWYWVGVSVDPNANVKIRVYRAGLGKQGTDIDTACLHDYTTNAVDLVLGSGYDGLMDELVIFDRAITFADMQAIYEAEYQYYENRPFTYYCDPEGNNARLGTYDLPWGPLSEVCTADVAQILGSRAKAGDTIRLKAGEHGRFHINTRSAWEKQFSTWLTIAAATGEAPHILSMWLSGAAYIKFDGSDAAGGYMQVSPSFEGEIPDHAPENLPWIIWSSSGPVTHHLWFHKLDIFTVDDSSTWDSDDWTQKTWGAIGAYADDVTVSYCKLRNICSGVSKTQHRCKVTHCQITGWADNAINSGGYRDQEYSYNTIIDSYAHNVNLFQNPVSHWHVDSIQISGPGTARNLKVYNNYINAALDPTRALKQWTQGLFLTCNIDGGQVYNNVVMVQNGANACAFGYGSEANRRSIKDLLVANNTIWHPYNHGDRSYIRFMNYDHEDVRENIRVVNNVTSNIRAPVVGADFTWQNNVDIQTLDLSREFVNYPTGDMHLRSEATLIDAGTNSYGAPTTDLDDEDRDASPDVGAYEYDPPDDVNTPPPRCEDGSPANGATGVLIDQPLYWTIVTEANDYEVWFGRTDQPLAFQTKTTNLSYEPNILAYETSYQWRIDPNNQYGTTIGELWTFTTEVDPTGGEPGPPDPAQNPNPPSGAQNLPTSVTLSWSAGLGASSYRVYLGTSAQSLTLLISTPLTNTASGPLEKHTTYYWRVDSVGSGYTTPGAVWNFRTGGTSEPPWPDWPPPGVTMRSPKERSVRPDGQTRRYLQEEDGLVAVDLLTPDVLPNSYTLDGSMAGYLLRVVVAAEGTDTAWSLIISDAWGAELFSKQDLNMTDGVTAYDVERLPFVGGLVVEVAATAAETADSIRVRLYIQETWRR